MITLEECLDYSELSPAEVDVIARHEHVPEVVAVEIGEKLLHSDDGVAAMKRYIVEDIEDAQRRHRSSEEKALWELLLQFTEAHPAPVRACEEPCSPLNPCRKCEPYWERMWHEGHVKHLYLPTK